MTTRIEALERLEKLRQSGTLSDAEFEVEKTRLLSETAPAPYPASPPGPAPDALATQAAEPARSTNWALIGVVGAFLALVAVALGVAMASFTSTTPNNLQAPVASSSPTASASPDASAALRALPADEQASIAFKAIFGRAAPIVATVDGSSETTKAVKVIWAERGPILITSTEIPDGCHACSGSLGVYYLKPAGATFEVVGRYPKAVEGWGWGTVPDWSMSEKFTDYPAIYAEGGYSGQGVTCGGATLTELRPEGPVTSDQIATGADNSGNIDDGTGKTFGGDPAYNLQGKIVNVVRGKSFEVQVTGTDSFTERYVRKDNKFVRVGGASRLSC
jgi:hypothetical protein